MLRVSNNVYPTKPRAYPYWKVYGISLYKKKIIEYLEKQGFQIGQKCLNAEIPSYIIDSQNLDVQSSVLRGIFDTDGSFWCERSNAKTSSEWKRKHNYIPQARITSCSKRLMIQCNGIANRLGIHTKIRLKDKKGIRHSRNINNLCIEYKENPRY